MSAPNEQIAPGDPNMQAHVTPTPAAHAPAAPHFTDAEWSQLQADDLAAGSAVVALMLAIFTMGVFLYAAVAYTVWQGVGFLS